MALMLNRTELAAALDISTTTIQQWENKGMPVANRQRGREGFKYNVADVFKWHIGNAAVEAGTEKPSDKRQRVIAEIAELELAERRGQVVSLESVVETWGAAVSAMKNRMRAVRRKAAPLVATPDKRAEVETLLGKLIDEALTELGSDEFAKGVMRGPKAGVEESVTPAEPDGKRMGRRKS